MTVTFNHRFLSVSSTALAGLIGLSIAVGGAAAQSPPREVLLGVVRVGTGSASAVEEPAQLYEAARTVMRGGQAGSGQRQLEQLIARYPDSEAANRARHDLADIYASLKVTAPKPAVNQVSFLGRPEMAPDVAVPPVSAWRTSVRPVAGFERTAQEGLRSTAGDMVFFSEGSAELGSKARKALAAQAAWLSSNPRHSIIIEGHADEAGSSAELMTLATARAQAVHDRLVEEGVAPDRIRIAAYGANRKIALCADFSCSSQNRRAVTMIGGASAAQVPAR